MNKNKTILLLLGFAIILCFIITYKNNESFVETLLIEIDEKKGLPCKDYNIISGSKVVFRNNNKKDIQVTIKNDSDYYRQSNRFNYNSTHKHKFTDAGKYKFYVNGKVHGNCSGYINVI